jgi:hypothetical protein
MSDMENWWWEEVEAFIRRHTALKTIYKIAVPLASALGVLGTLFGWLGIPRSAYGLLAVLTCTMAGITYVVAGVAGMRAKKYRRLLDTFRELVAIERRNYYLDRVEHRIQLAANGDAECTRAAHLCSNGSSIGWEQISIGVTPEANGVYRFEDLKFSVVATDSRVPLKNVVISDDERRKQVVVMFNPQVRPGKPAAFTLSYRWPKAWKPLLDDGFDYGVVSVTTRTKHLSFRLTVPDGYFIEHFHVNPEIGTIDLIDGKSTATWKADNLSRGDYRYEVHCAKLPKTAA